MALRGAPGLARAIARGAACLLLSALFALAALEPSTVRRPLGVAAGSLAIFAVFELTQSLRCLRRQRQRADEWLRAARGRFVPPAYAWRASQLVAPSYRRMLARSIRRIAQSARDGRVMIHQPRLFAVRGHEASLEVLAETLELDSEPVTPGGILRVAELVSDGGGALWGTDGERLERELETTLSVLRAA